MNIIRGIDGLSDEHKKVVLTIGNFDGVHIGHKKIFKNVFDRAHELGLKSMAITFEPHPIKVIAPERGIRILTPTEEKARLIDREGIDYLLLINFNKDFANIAPEDFIKDLIFGR